MTRVFLAGPIDYQPITDVIEYRLGLGDQLESAGYELVDQYSGALEEVVSLDFSNPDLDEIRAVIADLPDEPYVDALNHAIDQHSLLAVIQSPGLIPTEMPDDTVERLVHRDLELVETADVFVAYLPEPSCGTTVELLAADDAGMPTVVISEEPPTFVKYYADSVVPDAEAAIDRLDEITAD